MEQQSENFDWVAARASCSASEVFEKLRQQVESDVKIRQGQCPKSGHVFKFVSSRADMFSVIVETDPATWVTKNTVGAVWFKLKDTKITVEGQNYANAPNFEATLTLNEEGECRAKVNGQEMQFWQVRKMALEAMFFESF